MNDKQVFTTRFLLLMIVVLLMTLGGVSGVSSYKGARDGAQFGILEKRMFKIEKASIQDRSELTISRMDYNAKILLKGVKEVTYEAGKMQVLDYVEKIKLNPEDYSDLARFKVEETAKLIK